MATVHPAGYALDQANAFAVPYGSPQWFLTQAGRTYYISVDGFFGQEGSFTLSLRAPALNDQFENRYVLHGDKVEMTGSTLASTRQPNEPFHGYPGDGSLWWSWTAPASGQVILSILNGDLFTGLGVYGGVDVSTLTAVSQNFDEGEIYRTIAFDATESATYHIAVDQPRERAGPFTIQLELMSVRMIAPLNQDVFASPANIMLTATTPYTDGLREIQFYAGTKMVGRVTNIADTAVWTNVTAGFYQMYARAIYPAAARNSTVNVIQVRAGELTEATVAAGPFSNASYLLNSVGEAFAVGPYPQWPNLPSSVAPQSTKWRKIKDNIGLTEGGRIYRHLQVMLPPPPDTASWTNIAAGRTPTDEFLLGVDQFGEMYFNLSIAVPYGPGVVRWVDVACGRERAIALGNNGQVYTWGAELLSNPATAIPARVLFPGGVGAAKAVVSGALHFVALGTNDQLYAWGDNSVGQLGLGGAEPRTQPTLVGHPSGVTGWKAVSAGSYHTVAIANNGQLYAWGRLWQHTLGFGSVLNDYQFRPLAVLFPPGVTGWIAAAGGSNHSLAIGNDGRLYAWGNNDYGQLGIGPSFQIATPVLMAGFPNPCPPGSVGIESPASGQVVHVPGPITITATSNVLYSGLRKVEFFAGNTKLGQSDQVPSSVTWSNPASGRYWLTARATDSLGNTTISSAVDLRVNRVPTVAFSTIGVPLIIVAGEQITLVALASDSDGTIAAVEFIEGTNVLARLTQSRFTLTLSNLPPGQLVFRARAVDNLGGQALSEPLTIDVVPNQPPSFVPGPDVFVLEDSGEQILSGWATSVTAGPPYESGQGLQFQVTSEPQSLFSVQPALSAAGTLTFTPAPDANGVAVVSVVLSDNGGTAFGGEDRATPQTFLLHVGPVNDPPSFNRGPDVRVAEDSGMTVLPNWATGIRAGPPNESNQTVVFEVSTDNPSLFGTAPAISPNGTLSFAAAPNANGTATVYVTLLDDGGTANNGQASSIAQSFSVTVDPVNDPPGFTSGPDQTVSEDAGIQRIVAWASGISAGPPDESGQSVQFVMTNDNPRLFSFSQTGPPTIDPSGTLIYTPAPDTHGVAHVTVFLTDNGGVANGGRTSSLPQMFTITVEPVNDPPTAKAQTVVTHEDTSVTFRLLALDVDGDALFYSVGTPAFGSLTGTGAVWTYVPDPNVFGTDSFTFKVSDGLLDSAEALITLITEPVNDPPAPQITISPIADLGQSTGRSIIISANASNAIVVMDGSLSTDVDGDALQYFWYEEPDVEPFAQGVVRTNTFSVGIHEVVLAVTDGSASAVSRHVFEVVSVAEAIGELIFQIDESPAARKNKRPLISTLKAAIASFDQANAASGMGQLRAFQNKLRAQIAPTEPEIAASWDRFVRQLMDALLTQP